MSFTTQLQQLQHRRQSLLCVGLDPDPKQLPQHIPRTAQGVYDFCCSLVQATAEFAVAFKPQIAGFAAMDAENSLVRLIDFIRSNYPDIPVILDAKRGDIGNTAQQYASEAFVRYNAHAVTLSPYMGFESLAPFLDYADRGVFLLCRTSNPGADALQQLTLQNGMPLFEYVAELISTTWQQAAKAQGYTQALGLVVGATQAQALATVRRRAPLAPLLIPGIGAQGGDLVASVQAALGQDAQGQRALTGPVLINSSRAIIYASAERNYAIAAQESAAATHHALQAALLDALKPLA